MLTVLIHTEVGKLHEGDFFYMRGHKKPFVVDWFEDRWVVCSSILDRFKKIRLTKTYDVYA